jgi:chromosome segregation ATPase
MKTPVELDKWTKEAVRHIENTRKHKAQFEKSADEYVLVKSKLDQAEHHLRMLLESLQAVQLDMHYGKRWSNFNAAAKHVRKARESAAAALAPLDAAKTAIRREPATRLLEEQKTAVRLAAAVTEPRKRNPSTRDVAKAIMAAAGIPEPLSDSTVSTWLREFRKKSDSR